MKIGVRKINLKNRIKGRTTSKWKRQAKKAFIPYYGKKGMGWIKNPKKAAYNKIYNKTTVKQDVFLNAGLVIIIQLIKISFIIMFLPFYLIYLLIKAVAKK